MKYCKYIFVILSGLQLIACQPAKEENIWKLWYDYPARNWEEALPIGNGRIGAVVYGGVPEETLQLNEETIWAGDPNNNINPDARNAIPEIRKLIFEGKYEEAQRMVGNTVISRTNHGMPYQLAGHLHIAFPGHEQAENYYRELDISSAITKSRYTIDGVEYIRETFASFTDDVVVMRLTASQKGKINFSTWLSSPQNSETAITGDGIVLKGTAAGHEGMEGKIKFTTQVKIVPVNGKLSTDDTRLTLSGADAATIYLSMATNFVNYADLSANPDAKAHACLEAAINKDYQKMRAEHAAHYHNYFGRVGIDLGITESIEKPTDVRITEFAQGKDPHLAALYFQFGRYLLISSSQPGTQPANLQGIWNEHMTPPWDSKYTTNINTEMNYWPAEVTNLPELHEPLIRMIKELAVTGKESTRQMYGARGWMLHHNTDLWRTTGAVDYSGPGMWPTCSAWLCQHLWEHYVYSGDKEYLEEIYPVMQEAALFFLDFMVEEPNHKWLVIAPSNSPENAFDREKQLTNTAGTTMDNQLMFELFSNLITATEVLNKDESFAQTLKQARQRLAPMQIGRYNQLQEWMHDWDDPQDSHRHVSHLYGLFPGNQISPYRTPELFEAARNSLNYRGDASTGWSMGWKVCLWARFMDGDRAYKLITEQLRLTGNHDTEYNGGGTYPNLLDAHPPFQIDGNFGCTAGIAEMFMQSHDGAIHILPALPTAWQKGSIRGLRARGGFLTDIEWENGKLKTVKVTSTLGGNLRIRTTDPILLPDKTPVAAARGENPNPYYRIHATPPALISASATLTLPGIPDTMEYDILTEPGKEYTFHTK